MRAMARATVKQASRARTAEWNACRQAITIFSLHLLDPALPFAPAQRFGLAPTATSQLSYQLALALQRPLLLAPVQAVEQVSLDTRSPFNILWWL